MAFFERSALNPGVKGREVAAWAMYDFANSGYTTVVLTAVFNAYFVGVVAANAEWATFVWTLALSISCVLVMVTMPAIGAYADAHAAKKRLLLFSTVGCVLSTALLYFAQPGTVALAVLAIIVSNYFYSIGESLTAAFLPELSKPEALGKVSGWGWSFGYFGGMLSLGLCLAYVLTSQAKGATAAEFVPVTMLITAVIFGLASVPTFVLLRERATPLAIAPGQGVANTFARLKRTWNEAQNFKDFVLLLICGVFYQAGIAVVIALAAIYAEQAMKFTQIQTMILIFLVNIASALGAFGFGYAQDRIGHKRALQWTLVTWIAMVLLAGLTSTVFWFWVAATLAGLCMGSSQSCGRAMVGVLTPADRLGEFYGLWTLAVRLAAIVGPLTYGAVTWVTGGNHRLAILTTGLFFVAGLVVLAKINVGRGESVARAALADVPA
jgi:MFS transporter, UMF1 family